MPEKSQHHNVYFSRTSVHAVAVTYRAICCCCSRPGPPYRQGEVPCHAIPFSFRNPLQGPPSQKSSQPTTTGTTTPHRVLYVAYICVLTVPTGTIRCQLTCIYGCFTFDTTPPQQKQEMDMEICWEEEGWPSDAFSLYASACPLIAVSLLRPFRHVVRRPSATFLFSFHSLSRPAEAT